MLHLQRWLPKRALAVIAVGSFAAIELLERVRRWENPICTVTRFRLDAARHVWAARAGPAIHEGVGHQKTRIPLSE